MCNSVLEDIISSLFATIATEPAPVYCTVLPAHFVLGRQHLFVVWTKATNFYCSSHSAMLLLSFLFRSIQRD